MLKKKKGVRRRFFNGEFFKLMELRQSTYPKQKNLAVRKLRRVYASDSAIIFPLGPAAKKKRIDAEIRTFFKKTDALESFFEEFLGRKAR